MINTLRRAVGNAVSFLVTLFHGTMYWSDTDSTALARFGYNARSRTLDVHFARGRSLYRYHDVGPRSLWRLLSSRSLGSAFNRYIVGKHRVENLTFFPASVRRRVVEKQMERHARSLGAAPVSGRQIKRRRRRIRSFIDKLVSASGGGE